MIFVWRLNKKHTFAELKAKRALKLVAVPKIAPAQSCSATGPP